MDPIPAEDDDDDDTTSVIQALDSMVAILWEFFFVGKLCIG